MDNDAFSVGGAWLRCALHAHTTNSDGELPPDKLVRHYEWAGFDVLAITDHWVHEHGGVAYLAHTYWSGLRTDQFEGCAGLVGIEIWNAGCELEVGRGDSSLHWDEALERGRLLYALATDDSHHPGYDSALAWVWARCAERSQGAVLDALRSGRFYSSTGPLLYEVELGDDAVVVRCSPAASVTLLTGRRRGARANAGRLGYPHHAEILESNHEGAITAIRLGRPPGAPYGRVEVAGANGGRAWTNPLWH